MVYHGVYIAGIYQKSQSWTAKSLKIICSLPVRLRKNGNLKTMTFKDTADNSVTKGRVVYLGITCHHDKVRCIPAQGFHLFSCNR